jgi:plastocyanin
MIRRLLTAVAVASLVGCSGGSGSPSGPTGDGGSPGGPPQGGNDGDGPAPLTAAVALGNDFFRSGHNGTRNPAVDTVATGGTVTWTWAATGVVPHSVESTGSPSFRSSDIQTGDGSSHVVQFTTPGTYRYDCAVHGAAMTGTIVVR